MMSGSISMKELVESFVITLRIRNQVNSNQFWDQHKDRLIPHIKNAHLELQVSILHSVFQSSGSGRNTFVVDYIKAVRNPLDTMVLKTCLEETAGRGSFSDIKRKLLTDFITGFENPAKSLPAPRVKKAKSKHTSTPRKARKNAAHSSASEQGSSDVEMDAAAFPVSGIPFEQLHSDFTFRTSFLKNPFSDEELDKLIEEYFTPSTSNTLAPTTPWQGEPARQNRTLQKPAASAATGGMYSTKKTQSAALSTKDRENPDVMRLSRL